MHSNNSIITVVHKQHDHSDRERDWGDRDYSRSRYPQRDRDSDDRKWQDSRQDEPTSVVILHGLDKDFKEEDVSLHCCLFTYKKYIVTPSLLESSHGSFIVL